MTQNERTPEPDDEQKQPETGVNQDPATNTAPPSNPEMDREAVEEGKETLERVVNW